MTPPTARPGDSGDSGDSGGSGGSGAQRVSTSRSDTVRELQADLGAAVCTIGESDRVDWFGRATEVDAVLRPSNVAEVSACLRKCSQLGVSVVPVGGNTGLVGGTTWKRGPGVSVVLSTERLGACRVEGASVIAQAGVTIAQVQQAAAGSGLVYGVDLASRDTATLGGTIATNAGGTAVCAYGTTRAQILGVQAVLADGTVVDDLSGLTKDNTGYSLRDLWCGSEGTLGVITAARVRLHPRPRGRLTLMWPSTSLAATLAGARDLAAHGRLLACETVDRGSWRAAATGLSVPDPLAAAPDTDHVALVDIDTTGREPTRVLERLGPIFSDAVVALDERDRTRVWQLRELQSEWWSRTASTSNQQLVKCDVSLPEAALDGFVQWLTQRWGPVGRRCGVFGHVFEGSLHVQLLPDPTEPSPMEAVLTQVSLMGGSLSAEHGVGRDKAAWLHLRRSAAEIAVLRRIKSALDPHGVLNPGVMLD